MIQSICTVCGSDKVEERVWISVNDPKHTNIEVTGDEEDCWCGNCEDHHLLGDVDEVVPDRLELEGFKGIDVSAGESLFGYGMVYREEDGMLVRTLPSDYWDNVKDFTLFCVTHVTREEAIEEAKENIDELIRLTGLSKKDYLTSDTIQIISDLHMIGSQNLSQDDLGTTPKQLFNLLKPQ